MNIPRVTTGLTHLLKYGQIGEPVHLPTLESRLQKFFSSRKGVVFTLKTVLALTGQNWGNVAAIHAEVFQQGFFQFVIKVEASNYLGESAAFCVIMSKGIHQQMTDQITASDFVNLKKYNNLYPDLFVQPLVMLEYMEDGPVLYSSRLYPDQLEIDYKIDRVAGRNGLYINSPKAPNGSCRPFSPRSKTPFSKK